MIRRTTDAIVAMYSTHARAETAVRDLERSGFDLRRLSILAQGPFPASAADSPPGRGPLMNRRDGQGALWGGMWRMVVGSACFLIPGVGPVLAAGPIVGWILGSLNGSVAHKDLSPMGAGLLGLGAFREEIIGYEADVRTGKFLLMTQGTRGENERSRELFLRTSPDLLNVHRASEGQESEERVVIYI